MREVAHQELARVGSAKRAGVGIADKRHGRLGERDVGKVRVQAFGRRLHKRAVEGAGRGKAREALARRRPRGLGALNGFNFAGNNNLTRGVEVRRHQHLTLAARLAHLGHALLVGFQKRAHHAGVLLGGLGHKARALGNEGKRVGIGKHAGDGKRADLAKREAQHSRRPHAARFKRMRDAYGQRAHSRLGKARVVELFSRGVQHDVGHVIAQHIGCARQGLRHFRDFHKRSAHAGLLRALAGEQKDGIHVHAPFMRAARWRRPLAADRVRRERAPAPSARR